MIDPNEVEAIATEIETRVRAAEQTTEQGKPTRRHWPRRIALSIAVMVVAAVTHKLIVNGGFEHFMQSAELGIAALFDTIFSKAREV